MKILLLLTASLIAINISAQKTESYYDFNWKPCTPQQARFYSEVIKTDSGWLRNDYFLGTKTLQMSGLFEDSANKIANGYFHYFYANGIIKNFGRNIRNKKEGLWMRYYSNGMIEDSTVYVNGHPSGTSLGWHYNGYMADSVVYNPGGSAVEVSWNSDGTPSGAGHLMNGKLNGPWLFYYKNGNLSAREKYNAGKLESREYYNSSGEKEDTASKDRYTTFPGGTEGWKKFILKHIYFPSQYKFVNTNQVTVVVTATIDEDGNVTDPFVEVPFLKDFDNIAIAIFKKSPKWLPAIKHNRPVVQGVRQPITFMQGE